MSSKFTAENENLTSCRSTVPVTVVPETVVSVPTVAVVTLVAVMVVAVAVAVAVAEVLVVTEVSVAVVPVTVVFVGHVLHRTGHILDTTCTMLDSGEEQCSGANVVEHIGGSFTPLHCGIHELHSTGHIASNCCATTTSGSEGCFPLKLLRQNRNASPQPASSASPLQSVGLSSVLMVVVVVAVLVAETVVALAVLVAEVTELVVVHLPHVAGHTSPMYPILSHVACMTPPQNMGSRMPLQNESHWCTINVSDGEVKDSAQ
jgi:hypothetical protein